MHQGFRRNEIKKILNDFDIYNENLIDQLIEKFYERFDSQLTQIKDNYEIFMENANDFIAVIDEQFRFRKINEKIHYEKLGYKSKDLLGKSVLKFIHPDDLDRIRGIIKDGFKEGKGSAKFRFKSNEGNWLWIEAKGKTFTDSQKNPKALIISRDISKQVKIESELKRSEKRLKESQKRLRLFIDTSPDMFFLKDRTFKYILVNKANAEFFNSKEEDIIGKTDFDFLPKDAAECCRKTDEEAIEQKKTIKNIEIIDDKVYESRKMPAIIDGEVKGVAGIVRDITEQEMMERRLIESQEKYHDIAEMLPDIIYETNRRMNLTYLNSLGFEKLALNQEKLKEGVNLLDLVADEDKRKLQNKMKKILMGKSIDPIECSIDPIENNKEDKFYARVHSVPIYKNGVIVGIRGTISDVNNMVLAKKKIKESEEELKRLNNLKSELLRRTSHELKTPLVSIKGFSSLLLDQFKDALNENAVSMIEEIQAGYI
ncbi:MAG: PAS domain S-box protein, partial [Elusimicrobiota bacterium]